MTTYTTQQGDMLDAIVWRHYGRQDSGLVESVMEANRGLADYGPELPANILVRLPDIPAPQPVQRIQLFS